MLLRVRWLSASQFYRDGCPSEEVLSRYPLRYHSGGNLWEGVNLGNQTRRNGIAVMWAFSSKQGRKINHETARLGHWRVSKSHLDSHHAYSSPSSSSSSSSLSSSIQLFSTVSRTRFTYCDRWSLYKFAASTLAGDEMFGSFKSDWIDVKMLETSYVGDHRFCKISRHNSPVAYTLGWNMVLKNLTAGGLLGYCSSNCNAKRNVPSSNGVSDGPIITAFQYITLSGTGDAETPPGASS